MATAKPSKASPKPAAKQSLGARLAADPKLKAKYLSNPGLRSKLPDSLLSSTQLASRKAQQFAKTPITDGSTVTNAQLGQEATNYTTAQYAPQRQQLATQQSQAVQHTSDVAGWYDQYQRELAQHFSNVQQAGQQAITADQQLASGVKALDNTQAAQSQQAAQTDAAYRGGTVDPSMAQTANNASLVRQQMLAATSGAQASTNAANSVYADTLAHVVAPGQGVVAKQRASDKVGAVADAMKALAMQEGASKTDYMTKRTADERNYVLANRTLQGNQANQTADNTLAQKKLGLDITTANNAAKIAAAKLKLDTQYKQDQIDIRRGIDPVTGNPLPKSSSASNQLATLKADFFRKHGYLPPTGPVKAGAGGKATTGPGSLTPVAEGRVVSQARTLAGIITSSPKVDDTGKPLTEAAIRQHLLNGTNPTGKPQDPALVDMAFDLAHNNGALSDRGVAKAHSLGIHVGGHFKRAKTVKGTYVPPPGAVTGGGPNGNGTTAP